jgi:glycosyltransferase involved in cell wall biosynthesis
MVQPAVSIVIPTRNRADYLAVALASLQRQQFDEAYEVLVVDDGSADGTPDVVALAGAWCVRTQPRGANAARNTGIRMTAAPLIAFLDDDVDAPPGWLRAIREGADRHPEADAFGGPIRARFEGLAPLSCGREDPPITTLDLGAHDTEADMVWGANLAIRREAFERLGLFDETLSAGDGDEEDWLLALKAAGGRIIYLAGAGLDHRRVGADARLTRLARAAYHRGRAARVMDQRRGTAPGIRREVRILAGCAWHIVHYACPQGVIMSAHSAGRLAEALSSAGRTRVAVGADEISSNSGA